MSCNLEWEEPAASRAGEELSRPMRKSQVGKDLSLGNQKGASVVLPLFCLTVPGLEEYEKGGSVEIGQIVQ